MRGFFSDVKKILGLVLGLEGKGRGWTMVALINELRSIVQWEFHYRSIYWTRPGGQKSLVWEGGTGIRDDGRQDS